MASELPSLSIAGNALFDVNRLNGIQGQVKNGDPQALKVVAQQFESFFLKQILEEMHKTTFATGLMGDEQSGALGEYTNWMDTQMADTLSHHGLGLSDMLLQQWLQGPNKIPSAPSSTTLDVHKK